MKLTNPICSTDVIDELHPSRSNALFSFVMFTNSVFVTTPNAHWYNMKLLIWWMCIEILSVKSNGNIT